MAADSAKLRTGARFDGKYIGMGAGAYVGRIGGLAVALGIGAAVFVGHGVASAETGGASGSESSSTGSSESTSGASPSESKQPQEEKADASTDSSEPKPAAAEPSPKKKKKSSASHQSTNPANDAVESTRKTGIATARTVQSDVTESTKTADEPKVSEGRAPTASVMDSSGPKTVDVIAEKPKEQPPAPVEVVTTAISSGVSAVLNPFAGNAPTTPVESPSPWMVMAAARQEFGRASSPTKAVNAVTTSAEVDPAANALTRTDAPPPVVAIPQTAPLEGLQHLPIVGPTVVTPVVAVIHQIPLVGDVLHRFVGYPVQFGLPAGTPVPRDVKVISFDGTPIYVHFMPAAGLKAGDRAPTILDGPGLALPGATNPDALQVVWFCGGHGACLSTTNDGVLVKQATMDWLNRYVKGDLSVDTGPQFEWVDQHGQQFSSDTYPVPQGTPIVASSAKGGVLPLLPIIGGSGPQIRNT